MATREVEKSISTMETLPSSPLKILLKGSVWYIRKPFEVPVEAKSQPASREMGMPRVLLRIDCRL